MPTRDNPLMLAAGYTTATRLSRVMNKSLPTVHKMTREGGWEYLIEGGVMYVRLSDVEKHYAGSPPFLTALRALRPRKQT